MHTNEINKTTASSNTNSHLHSRHVSAVQHNSNIRQKTRPPSRHSGSDVTGDRPWQPPPRLRKIQRGHLNPETGPGDKECHKGRLNVTRMSLRDTHRERWGLQSFVFRKNREIKMQDYERISITCAKRLLYELRLFIRSQLTVSL